MGKLSNLRPPVQKDLWCWLNMYKQSLKKKGNMHISLKKMSGQMYYRTAISNQHEYPATWLIDGQRRPG